MCFGGGSSSPPPTPAPPPPPPSRMDESAAGRQAAVNQVRAGKTSGMQSTIATSGLGDTSLAAVRSKTLLGA